MRRPFLIIFIILLIVSFIYTNTNAINTDYGNEDIEIIGIVKYKKEKEQEDKIVAVGGAGIIALGIIGYIFYKRKR